MHTHKAGAHQRTSLLVLTHFFLCRTHLEMPPGASACSTRRGTAKPTCSSATPPTTCRGFWVATPPGWAPRTPPCCKPSSARVRVCVCMSGWLGEWRLCVHCSSSYCRFFPSNRLLLMEQWGEDVRHNPRPSASLLPPLPAICVLPPLRLLVSLILLCLLFPPCVVIFWGVLIYSVLILLQPGALSSGWQGRTSLRGANQLRQNLK